MRIGFIGAGKVGRALGIYFRSKGISVSGYYSRTIESAKKAASKTNSEVFGNLKDIMACTDLVFITTNDDQIEVVDQQLAREKLIREGQIIIHTSGSLSSKKLINSKNSGAFVASLHPIQSFAEENSGVENLENTVFTVEGHSEGICELDKILGITKNQYFIIDENAKALYHAGACVMSNYLVTVMDYGMKFFREAGLEEEIFKAMLPLIHGTLANIEKVGTREALTGPIARGDVGTVDTHIKVGQELMGKEMDMYKYLGLKTVEMIQDGEVDKNSKGDSKIDENKNSKGINKINKIQNKCSDSKNEGRRNINEESKINKNIKMKQIVELLTAE